MALQRFILGQCRHLVGIAAIDEAGGIGKNGGIPWNNAEDRAFFKAQTMGHPLIVGRKTFESWGGRPLAGRPCAVWTRHSEHFKRESSEFYCASEINELVEWCFQQSNIAYVCGGKMLYEALMPDLTDWIVTRIPGDYACDVHLTVNWDEGALTAVQAGESCVVQHYQWANESGWPNKMESF